MSRRKVSSDDLLTMWVGSLFAIVDGAFKVCGKVGSMVLSAGSEAVSAWSDSTTQKPARTHRPKLRVPQTYYFCLDENLVFVDRMEVPDLQSLSSSDAAEVRRIVDEINKAKVNLALLEKCEQELDSCRNSYERMVVHKACEKRFGDGRIGAVRVKVQKQIRCLERRLNRLRV